MTTLKELFQLACALVFLIVALGTVVGVAMKIVFWVWRKIGIF